MNMHMPPGEPSAEFSEDHHDYESFHNEKNE